MSKNTFPGTSRAKIDKTAQSFASKYPGSTLVPEVFLIHSTEGTSWPGYNGGATAPTMTIIPDFTNKRVLVRQHFPANKSARALENRVGGVETNTQNLFQVELIGTCDPTTHADWVRRGIQHIYMPEAPQWFIDGVADVLAWLGDEWDLKVQDAAPRGWGAYPGSYGSAKGYRLSFTEWRNAYGVLGHQHVPENSHGDPGKFPIKALIASALGAPPVIDPPVTPPVTPPKTAVWGKPETWAIGSVGPDVTLLGTRIVVWSKHFGLPSPYKVGPGPEFTETDRSALSKVQVAFGYGSSAADLRKGGNSDGYPGSQTFKDLAKTPPVKPVPDPDDLYLNILHWNVAGSDDTNGFGAKNATRGPAVGAYAKRLGFDVFLTCEAGQDNLRKGISKGLGSVIGKTEWMERAKAIWFNPATTKNVKSRKTYSAGLTWYLKTQKYGAAFFGTKDGIPFSVLEIHTDYRSPAKQAQQVQAIFKKWRKDTDAMGIHHMNTYVVGDFNWDGTKGDDPFKALAAWNFEEKGNRTSPTFMGRKHLDGLLAHEQAEVSVSIESRSDGTKNLSDHNPIKGRAKLRKPAKK